MTDPRDSDTTLEMHKEPIERGGEKDLPLSSAQQQPPAAGFFRRNKKKLIALGVVSILAIIIIPSVVIGTQVNDSTSQDHNTIPSVNTNNQTSNTGFDDSAQVNAETPPLNEHFRYGVDPIRGVNLGGWLVLEPFITPSIFEQFDPSEGVIDEWTLSEKLGPDEAKRQIQEHYETFVTEEDFKKIAQMGINHVRIPTGHWAVNPIEGEPFVPNIAWDYLLKGIQWARKYGIRVMVELHTAPGSQNGWNHSGRVGTIGWLNGTKQGYENAALTIDTVVPMVEFFSRPQWANVVTMFGVLNEPAIYKLDVQRSKQWYLDSYDAIRNVTGEGKGPYLTYHEGFIGLPKWKGFMPNTTFDRTVLETHTYLIFDQGLVSMSRNAQSEFPCRDWKKDLQQSTEDFGHTMVGEFSAATNDCAKYLNGMGIGARYDGTFTDDKPAVCSNCTCTGSEDWQNWSDEYKQFLNRFIERQMDAFESGIGWFFWNFKTENHVNPHWDYLLGWEQGWVPKYSGNRTYTCAGITEKTE
ncbi:hypothetical protein INT44_004968 [Umbelopsis vinacea]|uniref:glucan 1,3-beta-glucosidase n=1 Tax=Umbelopsis vinacea TaxID=44442 RepID=A0A8H7UPI1_9FUNG|nr:hypothetical protein INT44_004968 [Umbelopsis vinacea]